MMLEMLSNYNVRLKPEIARESIAFELQQAVPCIDRTRQLAPGAGLETDIERLHEFLRGTIDLVQARKR